MPQALSRFDTCNPMTVAHQALLSRNFPGKNTGEYHCFLPRDLPVSGTEHTFRESPAWAEGFLTIALKEYKGI